MNILNGQNLFTTLHLQRYWSKMAIFVPGRWGSGLNILIEFGIDKAEWCGYSYLRILHIGRHRCWRGLCVFGGLCVDMWRLVHQWSFLLFWQKRLLVYQSSQVYQDCTNHVPIVKKSQTAKMTIGVPIVTCLQSLPNTQSPHPPNTQSLLIVITIITILHIYNSFSEITFS